MHTNVYNTIQEREKHNKLNKAPLIYIWVAVAANTFSSFTQNVFLLIDAPLCLTFSVQNDVRVEMKSEGCFHISVLNGECFYTRAIHEI